MNKREFLQYLRRNLRRYSGEEAENVVNYYDELISEKIRDGMSEREAVTSLGDKREIVKNLTSTMDADGVNKDTRNGGVTAGAVAFGVIASPLLFPLGILFFVLVFVIFTVWISLVVAFGAAAIGGLIAVFANWFSFTGIASALIQTGAGLIIFVVGGCICGALAYYGYKFVKSLVIRLRDALLRRK